MRVENDMALRHMYNEVYESILRISGYRGEEELAMLDRWLEGNNIIDVYLQILQIFNSDIRLTPMEREFIEGYRKLDEEQRKSLYKTMIKLKRSDS